MIADLSRLGDANAAFKNFNFTLPENLGVGGGSAAAFTKLAAAMDGLDDAYLKILFSSNKVSEATARQLLATTGLSGAELDAKLVKLGYVGAEELKASVLIESSIAEVKLDAKEKQRIVTLFAEAEATDALTVANARNILSMNGITDAAAQNKILMETGVLKPINGLTGAFGGLGLSIKKAGTAFVNFLKTPLGGLAIVAAAIGGVVAITNALTTTSEEAMESFEKANSALTENTTGITSLNSELATNKTRMEELSNLKMPTLADEIELTALREKNTLLAAQLVSLEAVKKNLEDVTNLAGLKAYEALNNTGLGNAYDVSGKKMSKWEQWFNLGGEIDGAEALKVALQEYKATEAEMATIDDRKSRRYLKLQKDLVDYGTTISTVSQSYGAVLQTFEKGTPAYEEASSALANVSFEMGDAAQKASTFQNIISDYSASNEELISLAQSSEVTAEKFKELQGGGLGKFLFKLGFTAQQAADYLNALGNEAGTAADGVATFEDSIASLNQTMDSLPEKMEDLESIQKKISEGYEFGYVEIEKIKKSYPELIEYISKTTNGWQIQSGVIDTMSTGVRFTKSEIDSLLKIYPDLTYAVDSTTGSYYLEVEALNAVNKTSLDLKADGLQAQLDITSGTKEEISKRVFLYGLEAKAVDTLKTAVTDYENYITTSNPTSSYGSAYDINNDGVVNSADVVLIEAGNSKYKEFLKIRKQIDALKNGTVSGTPSGGDKTDKWKEAFEKDKAELDHQLAMSLISETQYTNSLEQKYKKYFSNKELYLEQYNQYEEEVYKRRISENIADFDKQKKALDHQKTTGTISEKKYTDTLEALYKKYFSNKKLYLEQYTQYEEEVYSSRQSILESDKEKIEAVFEATKDMIKQEWEDSKSVLESQKEALDDSVSEQVDALEEVRDREKDALSERKEAYDDAMEAQIDATEKAKDAQIDALNDRKDAMEDAIDAEIDAIEKSRDADKEALEEKKDNLDSYIEARKKALQEMREQDTYNDELSAKQKSVSDIQFQLNSMGADNSDAAIRRKLELQDELNKAQKEVSNYVSEHDYDAQIAALDAAQKLEDEGIDAQIKALEKKIDEQIDAFEASKDLQTKQLEAQIDAVNSQMDAQIEALKLEKDAQDKAMEAQEKAIDAKIDAQIKSLENMQKVEDAKIDAQIKVIDAKLANEGLLVNEAYTRMNGMNKKLYADLIEWNNKYGTGIQNDITDQWKHAYDAVKTYSGALSALGATTSITTQIKPQGFASGTMSLPYTGVVEHSENGAELILNAAKNGSNYAMLNKGSPIFTAEQTANLKAFMARPSDFISKALGSNVSSKMTGTIKASVVTNNNPTAVTINNDFIINGTDPSGIAEEIKKIMPQITNSAVDKINKTIFRNGGRLTANSMA